MARKKMTKARAIAIAKEIADSCYEGEGAVNVGPLDGHSSEAEVVHFDADPGYPSNETEAAYVEAWIYVLPVEKS